MILLKICPAGILFNRVAVAKFQKGLNFMGLTGTMKKRALAYMAVPAFAFNGVHPIFGQPCMIIRHSNNPPKREFMI
jgi:hypothetical protein